MSQLLQQAIVEMQRLPESQQDAIAAIILDEIADERCWDDAFARSQDLLARLASEAREEICTGRASDIGIDEL